MHIPQHLDFDVTGPGQEALDEDPLVAEASVCLALRGLECGVELFGSLHDSDPPPATAGRGFHQ